MRLPRLAAAAALLIVPILACGCAASAEPASSASSASSAPSQDSGIDGRTMVDAGCPVIRLGTPCPERPLSARITVTSAAGGGTVATVTSDADGRFRVALPPGTYTLHPANLLGSPVPLAMPKTVNVTAGHYTTVEIPFDSGVR